MVCTIDRASSSESSYEVVSSTASRFCARATSASSSLAISGSSPARPFSATSRTKLLTSSSASAASCSSSAAFPSGSICGLRRNARSSGTSSVAVRERAEVGRDRVHAVRLLRGLEERACVHALRDH